MRVRALVIGAAILCIGVVVASAAAAPPAGTRKDPVGMPMFSNWYSETDPGGWYLVKSDGNLSGPFTGSIAAGEPFMIDIAWVGQAYGHTKVVPDVDHLKLTITKGNDPLPVFSQTWAQGRAAWTSVFVWDDYWLNLLGPVPPFNPNMGTGTYGIKWENTFKEGFAAGMYHVVIDEDFTHVYNDLSSYSGDWKRPTKFTPYTWSWEFDFTVV